MKKIVPFNSTQFNSSHLISSNMMRDNMIVNIIEYLFIFIWEIFLVNSLAGLDAVSHLLCSWSCATFLCYSEWLLNRLEI